MKHENGKNTSVIWSRLIKLSFLGVFIILESMYSSNAWATQVHDRPEGLYVHQMAHIFFLMSMVIFVYWLRHNQFIKEKGWRYIQYSGIFFILWNLDAIIVHWIENNLDKSVYLGSQVNWSRQLLIGGHFKMIAFYICRMDHFLCVPAIVFLYLGIRQFQQEGTSIENISAK